MARAVALALWISGFAVGTLTHALELGAGGWMPYRFAPDGFNLFWTMLVVIDPLVIGLILWRRNVGIAAALIVMILDVAANSYTVLMLGYRELALPLLVQTLFLGFLLGSTPFLWRNRN